MRYLVTGAAGFIGSQVVKKLLRDGHKVVGVDDLNNYYDVRLKEWRLARLQPLDGFTFVNGNIVDYPLIKGLFEQHDFSAVFNLAARAGVRASVKDPWIYYDTNVKGTLNLLEGCRHHGVSKLVLASTSSIYGSNETPFKVDSKTDSVLSPYTASKKGAEALCHSYHYLYNINVSIPRYFTVYGPAGRPDMSYFKFMLKIDRGEAIDVYGDGKQARDFTYVADVAEATVRSLKLRGFNIFNVGNDRPVELLTLIQLVEKIMDRPANINYQARHPADNLITWADLTRTEELLKWRPQIPLEKGLQHVADWFFENRDWLRTLKIND